jgi:hypothetical protein
MFTHFRTPGSKEFKRDIKNHGGIQVCHKNHQKPTNIHKTSKSAAIAQPAMPAEASR